MDQTPEGAKVKLDPETDLFQVRRDRNPKSCVLIAKIFLRKFGTVRIHGLGEATRQVAIASEELRRDGYVDIERIETDTYVPNEEDDKHRARKKVQLRVLLKVTEDGKKKIEEDLTEREKQQESKQQEQKQNW